MKKKVFALVLVLVLVFAMNATSVMAAMTTSAADYVIDGGDFIKADALVAGVPDVTAVYGFKVTMTVADPSQGFGGGVIINGETKNWDQKEWGNDGAGKEFTAVATDTENVYTVTRLDAEPMFAAADTYANVAISQWWGGDITITKMEFLAADGSVIKLGGAAEDTAVVATEELPKTGVASVAVFYALGSVISAAGVMVAKKRDEQ